MLSLDVEKCLMPLSPVRLAFFPPFYYLAFLLGPGGLASNLAEDVVFGAVDILEVVKGHIFSKLR